MKIWSAVALGLASVAAASSARATVWQAANTCWADFDVGGGRFCGLRTTACADSSVSRVKCSDTISSEVPPPYGSNPPAAKHIALDNYKRVYLVGTDDKIYWTYLDAVFPAFSPQPPVSCINKLVATNSSSGLSTVTFLLLACNGDVWRYNSGSWTFITSGSADISIQTYLGVESLTILMAGAPGPIYFAPPTGAFSLFRASTDVTFPGAGVGGASVTLHSARAGGYLYTFLGGAFATCNGSGGVVPWLFENHAGAAYGPDPSGCSALQLPPGGFSTSNPSVQKMTVNRGPGNDILWILTDIARVYALTQ